MNQASLRSLPARFAGKALLLVAFLFCGLTTFAQVTTSSISGIVTDQAGEPVIGATVVANHVPSGTRYGATTNTQGRYVMPAVRVGGPYTVSVTYTGFETFTQENVYAALGSAANVDVRLQEGNVAIDEVTVTATRGAIFSSERTGAAQTFTSAQLQSIPTIGSRSINSVVKYNPQGNGTSFGGQDTRMNNFTIDGSVFNNGFGLGGDSQAGGRTNTTAISLDAIEELQVNVAPFDVRQSGFVGAGVNAVTRSGTNDFRGSAYYNFRNNSSLFNGDEAAGAPVQIGDFDEYVAGARIGGPIIKNKLFFFANAEIVRRVEPATTFVAAGSSLAGTQTRVLRQDLEELSRFLANNYGYETGPYEGYNNETTSDKFLARIDWNVNDANKLTLRYTHHNSLADQLISNSASLGRGSRRTSTTAMSYQNSGYFIGDNTRSFVAELNSTISQKVHNTFIAGYDYQNEDRQYKGAIFPTIDIMKDNATYISAGFDPFTPDNLLDYGTLHFTDNVSFYLDKHTVTVGANYERYKSNNLFFPGSHGVYVFDSLQQFYQAAQFILDNPNSDTSNVNINRFQYRYSALPGGEAPLQVLKANKFDLYAQDEFQVGRNFRLLYGLRASLISFAQTGLANPAVDTGTYVNIEEQPYQFSTATLPELKVLWEPRIGFNWDALGNKTLQLRGGTGVFTGRPPYVWISNQIGNNGVLTGFIDVTNTRLYPFTNNTGRFIPDMPTLPSTFDIAATDADYKFPQNWKTNFAIDYRLPYGFVATGELIYNQNVNSVVYFDANLEPADPNNRFSGPDTRVRFPGSGLSGSAKDQAVRINDKVSRAAVMTTTNEGHYLGTTLKLEYPVQRGIYGMLAWTFSEAKDLMSAGSIASGSWTGAKSVNGNNNLTLSYADFDVPNRFVGLLGYRLEYGDRIGGATQISIGYVGERRAFNPALGFQTSRYTYSIAGDMNGDGVNDNDLLYIPNNASELRFEEYTATYRDPVTNANLMKTFTVADQEAAFNAFIAQDEYLSENRGSYSERNGGLFPMLHRFDLSLVQELALRIGNKRNSIQVRADILNFSNLLNDEWGVGDVLVSDRPLQFRSVTSDGIPVYRMATQTINGEPQLLRQSFLKGASGFDVWTAQLGIRYTFE
jgi:hypothetical protein